MKLLSVVLMCLIPIAVADAQKHPHPKAPPKPKPMHVQKAPQKKKPAPKNPGKGKAKAAAPTTPEPTPIPIIPRAKKVDAGPTLEENAKVYFGASDYDGNGWISYREANEAFGTDRPGFAIYDTDHDGRISIEEFTKRFDDIKAKTGGVKPPKTKSPEKLVPSRNAEQLRNAYDANGDHALDLAELQKLVKDYNREQIPPEIVLEKLDRDNSGKLEGDELVTFSQLLSATYTPEQAIVDPAKAPKSIDQLFGQVTQRPQGLNTAPQPPQIKGPVSHFRRLDLDDDGGITLEDLNKLLASSQLSVRVSGVFAALDTDRDGTISESEFMDAMRKAKQ